MEGRALHSVCCINKYLGSGQIFVHKSCDGVCYQGNAFSWLGSVLPLLFLVPGLEEAIITMLCFALLTLSQNAAEPVKCHPWE